MYSAPDGNNIIMTNEPQTFDHLDWGIRYIMELARY